MTDKLRGRAALITGASRGLGAAIAEAYIRAGADVFLCARNRDALEATARRLEPLCSAGQQVGHRCADVASADDVAGVVAEAREAFGSLHVLINNAGVYGPKGLLEAVGWQDWVRAIEINLFGSVLMCRAVLPHFRRQRYGKIVQLSGGGATSPLPRISAYAASKAAMVRMVETLAAEVRDAGIDVNAIAPGALNTRLLDEVLAAGPESVGQAFYDKAVKQKNEGGVPLGQGAELAVFLGSAESDGISGRLISAVWDDWRRLPERKDVLSETDVYTLRRIIPGERGLDWDEEGAS